MGYLSIDNLYKNQTILLDSECYALEKVHGTSAHVSWKDNVLTFFSGGEKHDRFVGIFDLPELVRRFEAFGSNSVTVYGEAYGGKQQAMSGTYGPDLKFIVFDVKLDGVWLDVPTMADVASLLGFEVVPWERTSTFLATLDAIRDRPSEVAIRRGCGPDRVREGVVLRPIVEVDDRRGNRVIAKHKGDAFKETKTPRKVVDPSQAIVLREANAIAEEWVTEMRLEHVLGKLKSDGLLPEVANVEHTRVVLDGMLADVYREGAGEIVESKEASSAICRRTAQMFKQRVKNMAVDKYLDDLQWDGVSRISNALVDSE